MKTINLTKKEKRVMISGITVELVIFNKLDKLAKQYKLSKAAICRYLIESYVDEIKFIK